MVFVSHAREDRQAAVKLVHELESTGIACSLDPELIEGDPFWREGVAECFGECALMVGLVSSDASASPWVEQEQRAFTGRKLWIALHPAPVAQGPAKADEGFVPLSQAALAIRDALRDRGAMGMRRRERIHDSPNELRSLRMREEEAKLARFRTGLSRMPRPRLEVDGEIAWIGEDFLELRRVPGRRAGDVYVGTMPVTNSQFLSFVDATDYCHPPTWERAGFRAADAPVTGINWYEACAFANWAGASLPDEFDWLDAAGGLNHARTYATATGEIAADLASFGHPFGASPPDDASACPPNPEGYYGMCGNAWDWCATPWGTHRVIRGGGCMDAARFCAIRARYRNAPIDRDCCVGFRVRIRI